MKRSKIITLFCLKGGVGKTTSAVNVAYCLAKAGNKVLLLDLDPHAGVSRYLGVAAGAKKLTIANVLLDSGVKISKAIVATKIKGLFVIPSTPHLESCQLHLEGEIGRERILSKRLTTVSGDYDYIIIDTPPAASLLSINALHATRDVIVPIQTTHLGFEVIAEVEKTLKKVRRRINSDLNLCGYVATLYDKKSKSADKIIEKMRRIYGKKVLKTVIPLDKTYARKTGDSKDAFSATGIKRYEALLKEIYG